LSPSVTSSPEKIEEQKVTTFMVRSSEVEEEDDLRAGARWAGRSAVGHGRPRVAVETGGVIVFGLPGFGVGGSFYDRLLRGMSVGGRRPGGGGGVWAARPDGNGAANRAVAGIRWAGSAAGASQRCG
jgi:hypothetical protein